jgi:hypothetical protein
MPIMDAGRRASTSLEVRPMTTASTPSPHALPPHALTLLHRLNEQRVEYVLIGELAAVLHGCPAGEQTVVIVPARFQRNLTRLARALGHWRLATDHGALDIDFEPPATAGHLDLFENARRLAVAPDLEVEVAAIADLVRIAEMRRDSRDQVLLPALREALEGASVASASAP